MPSSAWSSITLTYLLLMCVICSRAQPSQSSIDAVYAAIKGTEAQLPLNGLLASYLSIRGSFMPLMLDSPKQIPVIAAGRYGNGSLVVAGHETLLNFANSKFPLNAALWLANATRAPTTVRVGIVSSDTNPMKVNLLPGQAIGSRYNFTLLTTRVLPSALRNGPAAANVHLAIFDSYTTINATEATWLAQYINLGGGMMVAGHVWYWGYSNPLLNPSLDHPVNWFLSQVGVTVSPSTTGWSTANYTLPATLPSTAVYSNAVAAAQALTSNTTSGNSTIRTIALDVLKLTLTDVPTGYLGSDLTTPLEAIKTANPVVATPNSPLSNTVSTLAGTLKTITMYYEINKNKYAQPASAVPVSPSAFGFPGLKVPLTPKLQTVSVTVTGPYNGVNGRYTFGNSWLSTGVYVPPGSVVTITIPSTALGKVAASIGCHDDRIWGKTSLPRIPEVTKFISAFAATSTSVASSYGGLLYIQIPSGFALTSVNVTITGNISLAPTYFHGKTTQTQWNTIKAAPVTVPWAEFVTSKIILTVNSTVVKNVANATALMNWWDRVLDAHAKLSQINSTRPRPERIVLDVEISAGWMHSGYPIMGYQSLSPDLVNLTLLQVDGEWGSFHELGHNHQLSDMEISGHTGECTVNIWSVHAMTTVVGKTAANGYGHSALLPATRTSRLNSYLAAGKPWGTDWNVWLCLETYLQLYEGFGWDFYYRLMNEYQNIPSAQRPSGTDAKIQQWITRSSKQAGVNLGPFYRAWNFPVSNTTLDGIAYLPTWTADPMIGK